jgi:hypothetical protein
MRHLSVILAVAALATLSSLPSGARADDAAAKDEAVRHFKAGVAILQDPEGARFEDAYAEFKRAYDVSRSPKVLGNLGLCAMKLERDGEAISAYTRYLKEVDDIDPEERAQVTRDLEVLTTSAISVTITTPIAATLVDTRLPVSGSTVTNFYELTPSSKLPGRPATVLKLRPGSHVLVLRADGKDRARWELSAAAGERVSHDFVVGDEPPAQSSGQGKVVRPGPMAVTGVGVAALIAGGVLGVVALEKVRGLESQCPDNVCPSAVFPANVNAVRPFVQATDYLLLSGGVVAVAGAAWWIAAASRGAAPATVGTAAGLDAACTSHGCFATAGGRF